MKVVSIDKIKIEELVSDLEKGSLIISPTDTVYGLLVDATNEKAVKKLIRFKNRPAGKAISVFVTDFSMMKKYVKITKKQETTLKELLPGPFTVVLRSKHKTAKLLESEKGSLGVRIPDFSFVTKLTKKFNKPITATSANIAGRSPHYDINSLLKEVPKAKHSLIDVIVDAGKLPKNKPSTVIDLTGQSIKTLRVGDIVAFDKQIFVSSSERKTKKIGQYIFQKHSKEISKKPLVFIISGNLGVGKTVMVKGIAELLGIKNIVSPTFVVYYEYDIKISKIKYQISKMIHIDLYNVQEVTEFKYLHIENLLKPKTILCFEWGEKAGEIIKILKQKAKIVYIKIKYLSKKKREIDVKS